MFFCSLISSGPGLYRASSDKGSNHEKEEGKPNTINNRETKSAPGGQPNADKAEKNKKKSAKLPKSEKRT